jgi:hypothetical protein
MMLPEDIVKDIISMSQNMCAYKIQRWFRLIYKYQKKCSNCGLKNKLVTVPACESKCCKKKVCCNGCVYYCKQRHKTRFFEPSGWLLPKHCNTCDTIVIPFFMWVGQNMD